MIDDDDARLVLVALAPTSPLGCLLWIILAIVLFAIVAHNEDECAGKHCPGGASAQLIDSRCLCVTEPKP